VRANATQQKYIDMLGTANTNWQDKIYQDAWGTDNNVAISGGIKGLPYRLSLGYNEQNGLVKTNEFRRTSVGLNLTPKLFDRHLSINANLKGSMTENRFNAGIIGATQLMDPTKPVYDYSAQGSQVGNFYEWFLPNGELNVNATANPLASLEARRDVSTVLRGIASLQLDYKLHFLPDLHFNVNAGYDYQEGTGAVTEYSGYRSTFFNLGTRRDYKQEKTNQLLETFLNYVKTIEAVNTKVDLVAGYSYQKFNNQLPGAFTYNGDPSYDATEPSRDFEENLVLLSFYGRGI